MRIAAGALLAAIILGVWVTAARGPIEGIAAAAIGAAVVGGLLILLKRLKGFVATPSRYRVVSWFKKAVGYLLVD
jgi:glycerol uptake facilitator-like aquaporin